MAWRMSSLHHLQMDNITKVVGIRINTSTLLLRWWIHPHPHPHLLMQILTKVMNTCNLLQRWWIHAQVHAHTPTTAVDTCTLLLYCCACTCLPLLDRCAKYTSVYMRALTEMVNTCGPSVQ
jgi:hypothetical protein